jgi:hypothetical protein
VPSLFHLCSPPCPILGHRTHTRGGLLQRDPVSQSFPTTPGVGDVSCTIETHPTDLIAFSHESVARFKGEVPAAPGSGPVAGLGSSAYCIVTGETGVSLATHYVLVDLSSAESLKILAGNCAQGSALAKAALSHISGM